MGFRRWKASEEKALGLVLDVGGDPEPGPADADKFVTSTTNVQAGAVARSLRSLEPERVTSVPAATASPSDLSKISGFSSEHEDVN